MWWLQPDHRLPRFAYCYFHPGEDPAEQAEHLVETVKARGLLPGDNFVLDLEVNDGLPPAFVAGRGVQFLHAVNQAAPGHRCLVYVNPSFAAAGNCAGMESWYLWIADYGVPGPPRPRRGTGPRSGSTPPAGRPGRVQRRRASCSPSAGCRTRGEPKSARGRRTRHDPALVQVLRDINAGLRDINDKLEESSCLRVTSTPRRPP